MIKQKRRGIAFSNNTNKTKRNIIMALITVSNLRPSGLDLFDSSESYLQELSDVELEGTNGGGTPLALAVGFVAGYIYAKLS
jgi:hypothetical protein